MINFSVRHRTLIVTVTGDIDQHNAASIREEIDVRISLENVARIIFDFSRLDFMDSSGIGIIIGRYKMMSAIGGKVIIVTSKPTIKKLLELSGIGRIATICDSLTDAMKTA